MKYLLIILWLNGSQAVISYPNQLEAQTRLLGQVQQARRLLKMYVHETATLDQVNKTITDGWIDTKATPRVAGSFYR